MTFSQLIEQTRIERANVAAQLHSLDAALAALSKIATHPLVESENRADVDARAKSQTERVA